MSTIIQRKIAELREREGLSQAEFAKEVGIPLESLKKIETRNTGIHSKHLLKITNHPRFKKYALWLVCDDDVGVDQEAPAPTPDEFAELLQSMSGDEVEQLVQYMEFLVAKRPK